MILGRPKRFLGAAPASQARLAYVRDGEIWTAWVDGRSRLRLTASGRDCYPSWSRDGTQIAFLRRFNQPEASEHAGELWVVGRDGSGERRLRDYHCSRPRWSPVANEIATVSAPAAEKLELEFVDPLGKRTRPSVNVRLRVEPPPWGWMAISDWHPEGKLLSFCIWGHQVRKGLVAEPVGDQLRAEYDLSYLPRLEQDEVSAFAWRPGKNQVAAVEAPGLLKLQRLGVERYTRTIWLSAPDGTRITPLYRSKVLDLYTLAWAPDGDFLVFESGGMLMRVDLDGTKPKKLWPGEQPAWAPR